MNMGEDMVHSGSGNDWIEARDETKDTIGCGAGKHDVVFFDKGLDEVNSSTCEHKNPDISGGIAVASSTTAEKVDVEEVSALRARN